MLKHSLSIYIDNHRNANIIEGGLICKQPHLKHINLECQHCCTSSMKLTVGGQNPGMILEIYTGGIVNSLNREGRSRRKPRTRVLDGIQLCE